MKTVITSVVGIYNQSFAPTTTARTRASTLRERIEMSALSIVVVAAALVFVTDASDYDWRYRRIPGVCDDYATLPECAAHYTVRPIGSADEEVARLLAYVRSAQREFCNSSVTMLGGGEASTAHRPEGAWPICETDELSASEYGDVAAYSFGIDDVWRVEEALAARYPRLVIRAFDPSMLSAVDHVHEPGHIHFYRTGLAGQIDSDAAAATTDMHHRGGNGWTLRRVDSLMSAHGDRNVAWLKFDTEGAEWGALTSFIERRATFSRHVHQVAFEIHLWPHAVHESVHSPHTARFFLTRLLLFEALGYALWDAHTNPMSSLESLSASYARVECCYELAYIRVGGGRRQEE